MKVDAGWMGGLVEVPQRIRELEAAGYDGAITAETAHDPFFPLLLAMGELILAMRASRANWYEGKKLEFRGEFCTHALMTPMFTPTDTSYGAPRVFLAAVGPLMTEVAGETADGMIAHAFTTEEYLREVTLPALERGLAKAGRRGRPRHTIRRRTTATRTRSRTLHLARA